MSPNVARVVGLSREGAPDSSVPDDAANVIRVLNESPLVTLDGQLCGLFAVDIVGFNGRQRDDDIQTGLPKITST